MVLTTFNFNEESQTLDHLNSIELNENLSYNSFEIGVDFSNVYTVLLSTQSNDLGKSYIEEWAIIGDDEPTIDGYYAVSNMMNNMVYHEISFNSELVSIHADQFVYFFKRGV